MKNEKIDIVIIWVDGNDIEWQREKNKYTSNSNSDDRLIRYRDWNLLKYWFRGVEKFAPWVNKVHFVTWGHIPKWLNVDNPKLNIVNHKDFIPKKYLPTFSSHTIELNLHRIKDLSEKFVYFNDDFYLISPTKPKDFFINNLPVDTCALNVHCVKKSMIIQSIATNNVSIINEHFNIKESLTRDKFKWFNLKNGKKIMQTIVLAKCPRFPGFYQPHIANSYLKSTFEEVWNKEYDVLDATCTNKFRSSTDVNQWLFREWQLASGNFALRNHKFGETFFIDRDGLEIVKDISNCIKKQKRKIIAINDGDMTEDDFNNTVDILTNAFETIMPEKSSFEK